MATNWTTSQVLAQLDSGHQWTGATITYAFPTSTSGIYSQGEGAGFQAASSVQRGFFIQAL